MTDPLDPAQPDDGGAAEPPKAPGGAEAPAKEAPRRRGEHPRGAPRRAVPSQRALRLVALVVVLGTLVGVGIAGTGSGTPAPPATPLAAAAPVGSQSSSWYCVGGGTTSAQGTLGLVLTNPSGHAVAGTVASVENSGATHLATVSVPAHGVAGVGPPAGSRAHFLAATVQLSGGGVTVAQTVSGTNGWSESPCSSTTSPAWYFASGSTAGSDNLAVELYNPTATPAVVNLTFVTTGGVVQPQPDQGIVLAPGAMVVRPAEAFVQNRSVVATEVTAKSGRVVAGELGRAGGARSGLVLHLGAPEPQDHWIVPSTVNSPGSTVTLNVLNPTGAPQHVRVSVRLPGGPVAPITNTVAAGSLWQVLLSTETRIPASEDYVTAVDASGGGVVVDRTVESAPSASKPRFGASPALVTPGELGAAGTTPLLSAPGTPSSPVVAGATVSAIAMANPSSAAVTANVELLGPGGFGPVAHGSGLVVPPHGLRVFEPSSTVPSTYRVEASGPLAVSEDLAPSGAPGVVSSPAFPAG